MLDHLPAVKNAAAAGRLAAGPLAGFGVFHWLKGQPPVVDHTNALRARLPNLDSLGRGPWVLELLWISFQWLPVCRPVRHAHGSSQAADIPLTAVNGGRTAALDGICQAFADLSQVTVRRDAESEATVGRIAWRSCANPLKWPKPGRRRFFGPRRCNGLQRRYQTFRSALSQVGPFSSSPFARINGIGHLRQARAKLACRRPFLRRWSLRRAFAKPIASSCIKCEGGHRIDSRWVRRLALFLLSPSFLRMCSRWVSMVLMETLSRSEISLVLLPCFTRLAISISAEVRL